MARRYELPEEEQAESRRKLEELMTVKRTAEADDRRAHASVSRKTIIRAPLNTCVRALSDQQGVGCEWARRAAHDCTTCSLLHRCIHAALAPVQVLPTPACCSASLARSSWAFRDSRRLACADLPEDMMSQEEKARTLCVLQRKVQAWLAILADSKAGDGLAYKYIQGVCCEPLFIIDEEDEVRVCVLAAPHNLRRCKIVPIAASILCPMIVKMSLRPCGRGCPATLHRYQLHVHPGQELCTFVQEFELPAGRFEAVLADAAMKTHRHSHFAACWAHVQQHRAQQLAAAGKLQISPPEFR